MSDQERPLGSRYVLERPLPRRGATGRVWRGRDAQGHPVAVKVLDDNVAADPGVVARFVAERAVLSRMDGDHVVRVHDLVVEGDTLAIVMDLVTGGDLRSLLERGGTLAPAAACDLAAQVADGLTTVHAAGVLHLDVKPENVLVDDACGAPLLKLTDFGVSRVLEASEWATPSKVLGTPLYTAPEVAQGERPSAASDVYSLGIVLYELLCGVTPFAGGAPMTVLRRHTDALPGRPDGLPDPVWSLVASTLAKDPVGRPASAAALADVLRQVARACVDAPAAPQLHEPPLPCEPTRAVRVVGGAATVVPSPPPPAAQADPEPDARSPRRGTRVLAGAVAVALLLAGGTGVVVWSRHGGQGPAAEAAARPPIGSSASASHSESSRANAAVAAPSTVGDDAAGTAVVLSDPVGGGGSGYSGAQGPAAVAPAAVAPADVTPVDVRRAGTTGAPATTTPVEGTVAPPRTTSAKPPTSTPAVKLPTTDTSSAPIIIPDPVPDPPDVLNPDPRPPTITTPVQPPVPVAARGPVMDAYCGSLGSDPHAWLPGQKTAGDLTGRIIQAPAAAYTWSCTQDGEQLGQADITAACQLEVPSSSAVVKDPDDAYSWLCQQ